ncbi:hypothetical protein AURDEDRAFT_122772 [Auricularia subglabra TFB-10046 SS5]|nr:hypothetical protein AURDEDRAFT_122772 [Auricularia subglabra TFB-10046 SS5]
MSAQAYSIDVLGVRDADGARALVSIDGGKPVTANFTSADGTQQLNQTVFSSGELDINSFHTLNLWYDLSSYGNRRNSSIIRLDQFVVRIPKSGTSPFQPPAVLQVSPTTSISPPSTKSVAITTEQSTGPAEPRGTSHQASTGGLVVAAGIFTGGGILMALIVVFALWRRKRQAAQTALTRARIFAAMTAATTFDSRRSSAVGLPITFAPIADVTEGRVDVSEAIDARENKLRTLVGKEVGPATVTRQQPLSATSSLPPSYRT